MKYTIKLILMLITFNTVALADSVQGFFCPQGNSYIQLGISSDQVKNACGQPQFLQNDSNNLVQNVPVTRLTYNNINRGSVYYWNLNKVYNQFGLPSGNIVTPLTILIVDNKVKSINFNGNDVQTTGVCAFAGSTTFAGNPSPTSNTSIGVGDTMDQVISACGNPDHTDQSYMQIPISAQSKPELWTYKLDQYSPSYNLLFINGVLQSIDRK
jgi:hypothetical protein